MFSAPAIQFKGTGWYITDYARKGKGEPATVSHGANGNGSNGNGSSPAKTTETSSPAKTESGTKSERREVEVDLLIPDPCPTCPRRAIAGTP